MLPFIVGVFALLFFIVDELMFNCNVFSVVIGQFVCLFFALFYAAGGESGRTNGPPVEQRGRKKTSDTPVTQKGSRLQPEVSDDGEIFCCVL